jgi:DNA topoisomerase-1
VPKGADPAALTMDEAVKLLAEREAKGGGKKPARGRATSAAKSKTAAKPKTGAKAKPAAKAKAPKKKAAG